MRSEKQQSWVHPKFWGEDDFIQADAIAGFHPEGISEISRGLSVRDTPGAVSSKWDLHPEGMLAGFGCPPDGTVLASLQDAKVICKTRSGGVADAHPRLIADIPSG